ncbi:cobalt-precorrin-7 (C(5))-methyltransferase [Halomicroarcula sp. F28]|uniref:cobalt-precorrin-7 (C(5))-methyltransferase n=1 Tax=Haloarcula salinisoli TaxID=2487746 RepID=UPI001C735FB9|nr:cobalt-precorrin-7 (C(5))-methyltransferase [Halomicroarcula salinisoli]MBX0288290.1 cobalt-precorrin-7 (C(5))-methyltransferase [Halomicroarcula salinisoli]
MCEEYDLVAGPDPATLAASAPERPAQRGTDPVYAVGIGPGNSEYLTGRARRALGEADVVVGFETVVEFVSEATDADLLTCGYRDEAEALSAFADRVAAGETGVAVLMGDPNHSGYQFVGKVQRAVDAPVRVVPGISSLQVAASHARTPMEDTEFVTLHKSGPIESDLARLRDHVGQRHLLVLPRPFDWMPGDIAADLVEAGADPSLSALVLERLTHDDEAVTRTRLGELASSAGGDGREETPYSDLSVLAVRAEDDAD